MSVEIQTRSQLNCESNVQILGREQIDVSSKKPEKRLLSKDDEDLIMSDDETLEYVKNAEIENKQDKRCCKESVVQRRSIGVQEEESKEEDQGAEEEVETETSGIEGKQRSNSRDCKIFRRGEETRCASDKIKYRDNGSILAFGSRSFSSRKHLRVYLIRYESGKNTCQES